MNILDSIIKSNIHDRKVVDKLIELFSIYLKNNTPIERTKKDEEIGIRRYISVLDGNTNTSVISYIRAGDKSVASYELYTLNGSKKAVRNDILELLFNLIEGQ